jgi:hypothetical protein
MSGLGTLTGEHESGGTSDVCHSFITSRARDAESVATKECRELEPGTQFLLPCAQW